MAFVERAGFGFAGGHAFFDGSDLLGLERQAAAGALGFEIQFGDAGAGFGERGFDLIAGFLGARVFLFLGLDFGGEGLETGLRLGEIER